MENSEKEKSTIEEIKEQNLEENTVDKYSLNNLVTKENTIKFIDVIVILLIYLAIPQIVSFLFPFLNIKVTVENQQLILGIVNISISSIIAFSIFGYKYFRDFKLWKREVVKDKGWVKPVFIVLFALMTMMLPSLILSFFNNITSSGSVGSSNQDVINGMSSSMPPVLLFILIVILAPIVEEIVFRALPLFYKSKNEKYNTKIYAVVRLVLFSVMFGLMHNPSNFIEIIAYSSGGIFLGFIVLLTNRLETAILVHMVNNYIGFMSLM